MHINTVQRSPADYHLEGWTVVTPSGRKYWFRSEPTEEMLEMSEDVLSTKYSRQFYIGISNSSCCGWKIMYDIPMTVCEETYMKIKRHLRNKIHGDEIRKCNEWFDESMNERASKATRGVDLLDFFKGKLSEMKCRRRGSSDHAKRKKTANPDGRQEMIF